ncbi:MAG: ATP-binding protein [Gammaproteobacteria bacterium]|nr:ATP-binding protein [Gammaproteobacteria bacterium]
MREEHAGYLSIAENNFVPQRSIEIDDSDDATTIKIATPLDIVETRQKGRVMAQELGCSSTQATLVATVISELARNIILYAGHGELTLQSIHKDSRSGIQIIATDTGPGIQNIARAMMNGFSTSGGLGLGLSGVKQIADSFIIRSTPGHGVRVEVIMWLSRK